MVAFGYFLWWTEKSSEYFRQCNGPNIQTDHPWVAVSEDINNNIKLMNKIREQHPVILTTHQIYRCIQNLKKYVIQNAIK